MVSVCILSGKVLFIVRYVELVVVDVKKNIMVYVMVCVVLLSILVLNSVLFVSNSMLLIV